MKKTIPISLIEAALPQTQCGECGYAGCAPYAAAMVQGEADINLCPPGGVRTLQTLAKLLDKAPEPYLEDAQAKTRPPTIAIIREDDCIGCTKCIQACPVDAIIGTGKLMHTIISQECTGCRLCIEPCPVDCIDLLQIPALTFDRELAKARFDAKNSRQQQTIQITEQPQQAAKQLANSDKQNYIQDALARVQQKRMKQTHE